MIETPNSILVDAANTTTSWSAQLKSAAAGITTRIAPSANDLVLAGPRLATKVASFVVGLPSHAFDIITGGGNGHDIPAVSSQGIAQAARTGAGAATTQATTNPSLMNQMSLEGGRSFGSMVAYATSRWSLACIIMTIVVNRTQVYAATRRPARLGWKTRLAMRLLPIMLLLTQVRWLLQSIQCQTSPDFSMLRYGNASLHSELSFNKNGGWLHDASSILNFGASDSDSCLAVKMVPPQEQIAEDTEEAALVKRTQLRGSLSRLWPFFETLCASQFVEVLSCALQGRHVRTETGMTLFEHSLAFAEAESVVSEVLGWGPFGNMKVKVEVDITEPPAGTDATGEETDAPNDGTDNSKAEAGDELPKPIASIAITREMLMRRINTSPEVLMVACLSALSHITSHILAIFDLQARFRLFSTGFFGLIYMATVSYSMWTFSFDSPSLLRFPTVCILGFLPHIVVLIGMTMCGAIYGLAAIFAVMATPRQIRHQQGGFWNSLKIAHENMQASAPLMSLQVHRHEDFYTALIRVGCSVLALASEAVYLNETQQVVIKPRTWLEEERLQELALLNGQWPGSNDEGIVDGSKLPIANDQSGLTSGYAKERLQQEDGKQKAPVRQANGGGIGAAERTSRFILAANFIFGIVKLFLSWVAVMTVKALNSVGIRWRPRWLLWFIKEKPDENKVSAKGPAKDHFLDFWLVNENGQLMLPRDDKVDVELEMRKRLKGDNPRWSPQEQEQLDTNIYGWWLSGGWFGAEDNSGQFVPQERELEDDTTSMISMADSEATTMDINAWESGNDENDDGRRTPTQRSPQLSRESSPLLDTALTSTALAKLLNPQSPEERAEAHTLAAHLASDGIMTRSRYRDAISQEKSRFLTSTRQRPQHLRKSEKLTPQEEAELLQYLIDQRRQFPNSGTRSPEDAPSPNAPGNTGSWAEHATGMESGGPQCVVCQSAPRSIIVWPCRCLSLCDDCRVTLAMNNFDKCVCCRRDVGSFSRIFVP